MNCRHHQKSLACFSHFTTFDLFTEKQSQREGSGAHCPPKHATGCYTLANILINLLSIHIALTKGFMEISLQSADSSSISASIKCFVALVHHQRVHCSYALLLS